MSKQVIVARFTNEDKEYIGRREVEMYDGNDKKTAHANVGLTLEVQREVREALKEKHGLKTRTSKGKSISYDDIEEV